MTVFNAPGRLKLTLWSLTTVSFVLLQPGVSRGAESIEVLLLKESPKEAIQLYGSAQNLTPAEKYLLAVCYQKTGDGKNAEAIWKALLESPERERALLSLAHLKSKDGAFDEAEKYFRRFLADFPDSQYQPSALLGFSEVLLRKKKPAERLKTLKRLRQKYPFSPEGEKARSVLLQTSGFYGVQVGSLSDLNRAEKLRENLTVRGYDAYLVRIVQEQATYRVRIGNYKSRGEAETAGRIIKQKTGLDFFITQQ